MYLPRELISGCRRQAFACPSQGTPGVVGQLQHASPCHNSSRCIAFSFKTQMNHFKLLALLLDCLVDSKEGQTNRIPKNLCPTKSTCYPPSLSTIVHNIRTWPSKQLQTPSTPIWSLKLCKDVLMQWPLLLDEFLSYGQNQGCLRKAD